MRLLGNQRNGCDAAGWNGRQTNETRADVGGQGKSTAVGAADFLEKSGVLSSHPLHLVNELNIFITADLW